MNLELPIIKHKHAIVAVTCITLFGGCSNLSRKSQTAVGLSEQGSQALLAASQPFQAAESGLLTFAEGEILSGRRALTSEEVKLQALVQAELQARIVLLKSISGAYVAFGELAKYNASGEAEKALDELIGSINNYAKVKHSLTASTVPDPATVAPFVPPITTAGGKLASRTFGFLVALEKHRQMQNASYLLRERVAAAADLLERDFTIVNSLLRVHLIRRAEIAAYLYDQQAVIPDQMFNPYATQWGFIPNSVASKSISKGSKLHSNVKRLLRFRAENAAKKIAATNSALIKGLRKLLEHHVKFESEEPLDYAAMVETLADINSSLALISEYKIEASTVKAGAGKQTSSPKEK